MNRRDFLAATASATALFPMLTTQPNAAFPIIDTHIHLFDTTRKQGVPWPTPKDGELYQPALPERYRMIAKPHGIVGAIVVEASPWVDDNQWVLDVAANDPMIVGMIGNLEPGTPDFRPHLDRLKRNPLFRGIRYGNLWGRNLSAQLSNPQFVDDLRYLAQAGLVLDTANPNPDLLAAVLRLTDQVPALKVIVDHLPQMTIPTAKADQSRYETVLKELGKRLQVFVKVSEVLRRVDGTIPTSLNFYRSRLDEIFEQFGEDRLLYGSDWPNSDQWKPFGVGLGLVRDYFLSKGPTTAEKYFWRNSIVAYHWQKRESSQPE
ncbi:amidohydrolase family protein [Spirosoma terrae]|uniref:Amidohydrolase family protein n=1 Tax=Spirosoma terrae TaxID=1968276 RepID=A0A6L9L7D1_9BACT|nr:amidohydrolase family protein [Spirosoma terrae]NDU95407.1 amidohydrolase family protein [Spirosoma terrae]